MKIKRIFQRKPSEVEELGLNLQPGDAHYRAYVGPPSDYDLVSAMVFNLLTCVGLRQNHRLLDIGCGSLRSGRLLIPYLNTGNYLGVEPNSWLVKEGIKREIGADQVRIKQPTFIYGDSLESCQETLRIDFALAQSIFSHCGTDLIERWLQEVAFHLKTTGALLATFLTDSKDYAGSGWVYPGCVSYREETMAELAKSVQLNFKVIDWAHPRQTWAIFSKPGFDTTLIDNGPIGWNRVVALGR